MYASYTSSVLMPYRSKSFFTHFYHDFLGRPFFLFLVISTASHIWELMPPRMTWPYHRRRLWIIISSIFTATPTPSRRTSVDILSASLTPHIILIIRRSNPTQPHLICHSNFPCFTTVQQTWSNTTLINLPPLLRRYTVFPE